MWKKHEHHNAQPTTFISAVIPAAGSSRRMAGENKLTMDLCGIPVLARTLLAFEHHPKINEIILVCREQDIIPYKRIAHSFTITKLTNIIRGGDTRSESVLQGINAAKQADYIAIHDAARPLVSASIIDATLSGALSARAATPSVRLKDSIKRLKGGYLVADIPREELAAVQTPQVFERALIEQALNTALQNGCVLTDDCAAVERFGVPVLSINGDYRNIKITTPEDIIIAEAILNEGALL